MASGTVLKIEVELEGKTYAVIETETRDYGYYSKAYTRRWGPKVTYKREVVIGGEVREVKRWGRDGMKGKLVKEIPFNLLPLCMNDVRISDYVAGRLRDGV